MGPRKNLLWIVVDCLRADALFGEGRTAVTPTIDSLRGAGVSFHGAITAASYTTASFASMLTGLYPAAHGVRAFEWYALSPACATVTTVLRECGYHTAAFVTGPLLPEVGLNRGFVRYESRSRERGAFGPWGTNLLAALPGQAQEPWFVLLHLWALHHPRAVAPECDSPGYGLRDYDRALSSLDGFIGEVLKRVDLDGTLVVLNGDHGEILKRAGAARAALARANMAVRWVLKHLGPLRPPLERIARSRCVPAVLQTAANRHGHDVSEAVARVPLVIAGAEGVLSGVSADDQVSTTDIAPTLLELLDVGAERLGPHQGRSLVPLMRGEPLAERPVLIEGYTSIMRRVESFDPAAVLVGIRTPRWKLVLAPENPRVRRRLYDLKHDPNELRDAAGSFPEVADELHAAALRIIEDGKRAAREPSLLSAAERGVARERLENLGYL